MNLFKKKMTVDFAASTLSAKIERDHIGPLKETLLKHAAENLDQAKFRNLIVELWMLELVILTLALARTSFADNIMSQLTAMVGIGGADIDAKLYNARADHYLNAMPEGNGEEFESKLAECFVRLANITWRTQAAQISPEALKRAIAAQLKKSHFELIAITQGMAQDYNLY